MQPDTAKIKNLPIDELRVRWSDAWGCDPHIRLGRTMMEASLLYKLREPNIENDVQKRLDHLVRTYKRNPAYFDKTSMQIKPGSRLVRVYNGKNHSVLVKADGFEYEGRAYGSLSKIANEITGSRWNGWLFFGLKK